MTKPKIETPGVNAQSASENEALIPSVRPPLQLPKDMTVEQLAEMVVSMQAALHATQAQLADVKAGTNHLTEKAGITPVSMDHAKKLERESILNGEVPKAIFTHEGWHVPAMAHSNVDSLEREQDRLEKADARAAAKKKA